MDGLEKLKLFTYYNAKTAQELHLLRKKTVLTTKIIHHGLCAIRYCWNRINKIKISELALSRNNNNPPFIAFQLRRMGLKIID